VLAMVARQIHR